MCLYLLCYHLMVVTSFHSFSLSFFYTFKCSWWVSGFYTPVPILIRRITVCMWTWRWDCQTIREANIQISSLLQRLLSHPNRCSDAGVEKLTHRILCDFFFWNRTMDVRSSCVTLAHRFTWESLWIRSRIPTIIRADVRMQSLCDTSRF